MVRLFNAPHAEGKSKVPAILMTCTTSPPYLNREITAIFLDSQKC